MENSHNITISSIEDLITLHYFANLANIYERKQYKNEYEMVIAKRAYDIIPKIVSVNGGCGYVILEDKTIRCTDQCSWFVAQYDGCTEQEMHCDYNNAIRGY